MINNINTRCTRSRYHINWQELRKAYQVFMRNPPQGILHIREAGRHSRWQAWVMDRLSRQAEFIVEKEVTIDLDALAQLPPDTLGGAYARQMLAQGFIAESFIDRDQDTIFERRLGLAHDVQHIITGFDNSPLGEYGLAAFMLVQYGDLLNVFVLSWVPWSMIGNFRSIPQLLRSLWRGFTGGLRSRPLVAYPFEDNWHKSIRQVRKELHI